MKRICLISGRNNVGKSSLLEALFLFMVHVSSDVIRKINYFRGNLSTDFFSTVAPLFFNMDLNRKMSISVKENELISKLSFKKDNYYLPHSSNGISENIIAQFRSATKESYSLQFQFTDGHYAESGHFFSNGDSILRQIESNLPGNEIRIPKPTQFINSALTRSFVLRFDLRFSSDIQGFDFCGINNLTAFLASLKNMDGFDNIHHLLILRDAERNTNSAIDMIQSALDKNNLPVPKKCNQWLASGNLSISYTLMPACDENPIPGAFEDLCWDILTNDDNHNIRREI